jgi:hypothetical protein
MDTLTILEDEKAFRERTELIFNEAHKRAKTLPDHTVQVIPGEALFKTIQEAIESIHDASQKLEYQVLIGPGTYNERIKTKEFTYVVGAGIDETRINQHGFEDKYVGAVQAMSNGGLSSMTINATGPHPESEEVIDFNCIAILMQTPGRYHISGVNIHSTDNKNKGVNVRGISNKIGMQTGFLLISNCNILAMATGEDSNSVGIEAFHEGSNYSIDFCVIEAGINDLGIMTAEGANLTVGSSTITGQIYALYDTDGKSIITANQCVINGPVSSGVIVNP